MGRHERTRTGVTAAADPARSDRIGDRGFGLVEVVVTVALMGVALVPIMLAALMTVRASSHSRTSARVETVLANAADRVTRANKVCDYTVYVQAAALAQGWKESQVSATYAYWKAPALGPTSPAGEWVPGAACPNGVRPDRLVQRVTITVTSPDGSFRRTMEVVKSDV
jgi:prepilin-type N-terminal cleavage/methylation domain-containing protein